MTVLYIIITALAILIVFLLFFVLITREKIIRMENWISPNNHENNKMIYTSELLENVSWDLKKINRSITDMADRDGGRLSFEEENGNCHKYHKKTLPENSHNDILNTLHEILEQQKEINGKLGQFEQSVSILSNAESKMNGYHQSLDNIEENVTRLVQMRIRPETIYLNGSKMPKWIKVVAISLTILIALGCIAIVALFFFELKK